MRSTLFRSFADRDFVRRIARDISSVDSVFVLNQGDPDHAWREKIRLEKPFSLDEMMELAQAALNFVDDVKIRTRENGEEKVV